VVFNREEMFADLHNGTYDPLWAAAATHDVPIMLHVSGHVAEVGPVARRHRSLRLLIDHMGLHQPPSHREERPFEHLDDLLRLSEFPNVGVKISGVASLSREPYPFADLWPPLHAVINAFGIERVAWGSDFTRLAEIVNYASSLFFILHSSELKEADKEWLLGRSIRSLLRWPASASRD
jgi:predicted TIM-barrel fold metal-dependent hydrolase